MAVELANKYVGRVAAGYEARRELSPKWRFEQQAVADLLRSSMPRTVLDAPVGTGRFLALYDELCIEATGVDVSLDMLRHAAGRGSASLMQADLFRFTALPFDCVVCIRFLGWLSASDKDLALAKLAELSGRHVLLSITTAPAAFVQANGAVIAGEAEFGRAIAAHGLRTVHERTAVARDGATARIVLLERQ